MLTHLEHDVVLIIFSPFRQFFGHLGVGQHKHCRQPNKVLHEVPRKCNIPYRTNFILERGNLIVILAVKFLVCHSYMNNEYPQGRPEASDDRFLIFEWSLKSFLFLRNFSCGGYRFLIKSFFYKKRVYIIQCLILFNALAPRNSDSIRRPPNHLHLLFLLHYWNYRYGAPIGGSNLAHHKDWYAHSTEWRSWKTQSTRGYLARCTSKGMT